MAYRTYRSLAPVLFDDHDRKAAEQQRSPVVAPAQRSPAAQAKTASKRTADDLPMHSRCRRRCNFGFRLSRLKRKFGGVSISNGIVWSQDQRTMYYVDTGRNDVRAYDYDVDSGAISNERVTVTNGGSGHFDGMTMDEGMLWIAIFGGSAVRRYHPESGELLATVDLPMSNVTSCAFGGRDLTDLYITSACLRLSEAEREAQPLAGSLVKVVPGVRGLPAVPYAG